MNRPPIIRASFEGELVVDNFAGGGGASSGIESALGRGADIAINHSPQAIAMHKANHPNTRHFCENILEVDPREACGGLPVGLAWFSPDCTHFSRAKGGKPVKKEIRGLANVVVSWAKAVQPRVIILENVEEFKDWGPLDKNNRPIKSRAGEDFRAWCGKLRELGYSIEFKSLVAADYGTPTTRKRLFMVARRDGQAGVWPEPSHGDGRTDPWRTAAEIIDFGIPCPSIFTRKKPLAEKTLIRIAAGIRRYVIETAEPFIIPVTHQGGYNRGHDIRSPLPTVTGANRGELALVSPALIKYHGGVRSKFLRSQGMMTPITTVDTSNRFGLVAAFLSRYFGQSVGQSVGKPAPTVTPGGQGKTALASVFLSKHYGGVVGHGVRRPIGTVTSVDHHSLTCAFLSKYYGTTTGSSMDEPVHTVTTGGDRGGGHFAKVAAFMVKYYGTATGQGVKNPLATVTTKARFGLVLVHGEPYQIVDIGMRMLQPGELFGAQGFPRDYIIQPEFNGKPMTKTAQISLAGNAVCPQVAEALVRENAA
ncbi:MAG: DNA cytosine methyltransferase [Planctomycetota bacterium]|nr:DNA cytosine methyltransferase [Planctomycetota bacterium]